MELTAGTFNAKTLLECNYDQVIVAGQWLFNTLSRLVGVCDLADNPTPPNGTTYRQITLRVTINKVLTPINDSFNSEHTGSLRYDSAESEDELNDRLRFNGCH